MQLGVRPSALHPRQSNWPDGRRTPSRDCCSRAQGRSPGGDRPRPSRSRSTGRRSCQPPRLRPAQPAWRGSCSAGLLRGAVPNGRGWHFMALSLRVWRFGDSRWGWTARTLLGCLVHGPFWLVRKPGHGGLGCCRGESRTTRGKTDASRMQQTKTRHPRQPLYTIEFPARRPRSPRTCCRSSSAAGSPTAVSC